jgi:hypothetical protein
LTGKSVDVIIANFPLNAVGSGGTSSPLNIEIVEFYNKTRVAIPVTSVNGTLNITASGTHGNSGDGGGGVASGESFDNIAISESYDKDLVANIPVTYTFKAPELGVYEIAFTDKENENGITLRVEALKGTSKQVTAQAPGTVQEHKHPGRHKEDKRRPDKVQG